MLCTLQILRLSGNALREIGGDALSHNTMLATADFSDNLISQISADAFAANEWL